jgi:hypothetical protein
MQQTVKKMPLETPSHIFFEETGSQPSRPPPSFSNNSENQPQTLFSMDESETKPNNFQPMRDEKDFQRERERGDFSKIRNAKNENILNKKKSEETAKKNVWMWIYGMQFVVALISSLIVIFILYISNPPLTQTQVPEDGFTSMEQDWKSVLVVFVVIFLVIFLVPNIWSLIQVISNNSDTMNKIK